MKSRTHYIRVTTPGIEESRDVANYIRDQAGVLSAAVFAPLPSYEGELDHTLGVTGTAPVTIHIHANGCQVR